MRGDQFNLPGQIQFNAMLPPLDTNEAVTDDEEQLDKSEDDLSMSELLQQGCESDALFATSLSQNDNEASLNSDDSDFYNAPFPFESSEYLGQVGMSYWRTTS